MGKKVWFSLVGMFLASLFVVSMFGCAALQKALTAAVDTVTKVGSSETTISGTLTYSDGTIDINLNPVIASGDAVTITPTNTRVRIGTDLATITSAATVSVTVPVISGKKIDVAFILDNTGSMGTAITGSKNSIVAFAQTLEAGGVDAKFGLVTFGDAATHPTPIGAITAEGGFDDGNTHVRPVADFGSAAALQNVLSAETFAEGGAGLPENPLNAITYAYNNFTWRSGSQKVFIVITDINAHQSVEADTDLENKCTTTATNTVTALFGKAVVYAVSPNYTTVQWPYVDVRRLADGFGEGRVTAETCTGGTWITFESSGFDLNTLGIATTLTSSYTVRFSSTLDSGTWYIFVEIDTNGDGIFDSNMLIKVGVTSSSVGASSANGTPLKAFTSFSNAPAPKPDSALGAKPYVGPPNK